MEATEERNDAGARLLRSPAVLIESLNINLKDCSPPQPRHRSAEASRNAGSAAPRHVRVSLKMDSDHSYLNAKTSDLERQ